MGPAKQQQAIVLGVYVDTDKNNVYNYHETLNYLNDKLKEGWRIVRSDPMGAGGAGHKFPQFASLVVIEK